MHAPKARGCRGKLFAQKQECPVDLGSTQRSAIVALCGQVECSRLDLHGVARTRFAKDALNKPVGGAGRGILEAVFEVIENFAHTERFDKVGRLLAKQAQ